MKYVLNLLAKIGYIKTSNENCDFYKMSTYI